jgi:hypothetical protein
VRRHGLGFTVKLLDFYDWGGPRHQKRAHDVLDLVRLLYDSVGERSVTRDCPPRSRLFASASVPISSVGSFPARHAYEHTSRRSIGLVESGSAPERHGHYSTQILRKPMEFLDTGGSHGQQIGATFQKSLKRRPHSRPS